jgi:hypothetical protein
MRLRRPVQGRPAGPFPLALGLFALAWGAPGGDARAQPAGAAGASPAEIVAARELFRQGTADADAGRFAEGLDKFRRVAAVKETAAVRFNIARCEEALGRTGGALADFELAAREAGQDPKAGAEDVGRLAMTRADALRPRVPRLTLVAPPGAPEGMSVSLDGGKLSQATLGVALPVDPGPHVIEASAPSAAPYHAKVTLDAGDAKSVRLVLAAAAPDAPAAEHAPSSGSSSQRTWGWVAVGAGAALGVGSIVMLVLHNSAVATINGDCPGGRCPASQQSSIQGTESNARNDQTFAIVLAAGAAVAIGGGIVLVATSPSEGKSVTVSASPAGLALSGRF